MKAIQLAAGVSIALATVACGEDSSSGGSGGSGGGACNTEQAQMTASPTASPTTGSVGDTVTVTVPVNANAVQVAVQLLSAADSLLYGNGSAGATGAGDVDVDVQIETGAPAGTLYPFVQVYECFPDGVTQYSPSLTDGAYMANRPTEGTSEPSSFAAPAITVQ
jgi:hypothetical protein